MDFQCKVIERWLIPAYLAFLNDSVDIIKGYVTRMTSLIFTDTYS